MLARMAGVVGLDGYKRGWVAVLLGERHVVEVRVFETLDDVMAELPDAAAYGIDIPVGLPSSGVRAADAVARRFVGPRASSVFATPPRAVIEAPTYAEARLIGVSRFGRGVSAQSYRLREKILEADAAAARGIPLHEVHPEVSFRAIKGAPLSDPKRSWNGQMERRTLLRGVGVDLADRLDEAGHVPVDDVLDAAAVAWSAARIARGDAVPLPDPPERDDRGRPAAIWY